ncbi:MAG: alpha/beta hydrolase [bacterium]|nr:alpha/beta hydrolase [bacterium]
MKKVFIVHGAGGGPHENWIPWLGSELEKLECEVSVPQFPIKEGQNLNNWLTTLQPFRRDFDEKTIFVGHSIGVAFILNILETLKKPALGSFLVSGFIRDLNLPEFDTLNHTFYEKNFDWNKIKANGGKIYLFHGDEDPFVPLDRATELASRLEINPIVIPNGGHLNEKAGFKKFELLLEKIKEVL